MSYLNLPLLHVFHLVVERGSFQAAAAELNLPRSSVSKKVRQLEEFIGQPLLQRSTRQLQLTDVGQNLLVGTGELGKILTSLNWLVDDMQQSPKGRVRISVSVLMGRVRLVPILKRLREAYPYIELELSFEDRNVDLLTEKVDIAMRIGQLPDSSLIARKISEKRWGWFASPEYLAARGYPLKPDDLLGHDCLVCGSFNFWPFQGASGDTVTIEVKSSIRTSNGQALVDMACEGLGVMMLDPSFVVRELEEGKLLPILTDWHHPESSPVSLVCVGGRTKATEAVWQFLVDEFQSS